MLSKSPCASTHCHTYEREVVLHGQLDPGYYLLIPSTYKPGAEARFLIRVFSFSPTSLRQGAVNGRRKSTTNDKNFKDECIVVYCVLVPLVFWYLCRYVLTLYLLHVYVYIHVSTLNSAISW